MNKNEIYSSRTHIQHTAGLRDAVAAEAEGRELETLVEVLGGPLAQAAVAKHLLPNLIDAEQRGYWKV